MGGRIRSTGLGWAVGALAVVVLLATTAVPVLASSPSAASAGGPTIAVVPPPGASGGRLSAPTAPLEVAPAFVPAPGTAEEGPLASGLPLSVLVGLAPSDPSGFAATVASEYVPGSSQYHVYLSPAEIAARFAPSPGTVRAAESYFAGFGLNATTSPSGFLLEVRGPSAGVGRAFGTTFERYIDPSGRQFVSHSTAATLPAGIPWTGAYGLGNATPFRPATSLEGRAPVTLIGPTVACAPASFGLSPCDVQRAYSLDPLLANGTNGSGVRIGVVDAYDSAEPATSLYLDFRSFTTDFGLPSSGLSFAYPVRTTANLNRTNANVAWGVEEALDIEWAKAMAPGASVEIAFSPDAGPGLVTAIDWLVASASVNVISLSWGEPFSGVFNAFSQPCFTACNASTDGTYTLLNPIFEAAAAEGIGVFSATGDCGAADGTSGLAVNYPATDPFVTAIGGTLLKVTSTGSYLTESGWNGSSPGSVRPGCGNQGGSGGGYSHLPRPSWQAGLPEPFLGRATPDVSADAATPALIVYEGATTAVGGTSLSTPVWAGIAAVADQYARAPLGDLNPGLYRVYDSRNYSTDFHDILVGNNGYSAGPRWDPVTGIGTPVISSLVRDLTGTPVLLSHGPGVLLFASPRYGRAPLTVSFAMDLTGSHPIAGVNFGDGNSSLDGAPFAHTYTAPGVYSAQGFAADAEGNGSVSPPIAIVVGGGTALAVRLTASSLAVPVGGSVTFGVSATGGRGPYLYNYSFGDGTYLTNQTGLSVVHVFRSAGAFCSEVVARDSANPIDGGVSARLGLTAGGGAPAACGNDLTPLTLTRNSGPEVRDAPAEFPTLFASAGGISPPVGLANSVQYLATDPYVRACQCAIFPTPGNYSVLAWENDTVSQGGFATTNVTVAPSLQATFDASTLSGTAPLSVDFSSTVAGGYRAAAAATRWQFGDGTQAVGAAVTATYTLPGEYLAIGAVSDGGFGNSSEAFLIDVQAPGPVRSYGVTGTIAPAVDLASGATVRYQGDILAPAGSGPATFAWNLGEGFAADTPEANQTYYAPLPGFDLDSLTIAASVLLPGGVAAFQTNFTLPSFFAVEAGGFVPRVAALTLATEVGPEEGPSPLLVHGNALATGSALSGTVDWAFGDGARASGNVVNHSYPLLGVFTLTVSTGDTFGHSAVDSYGLEVNPGLSVAGGPSTSQGIAPLTVTFSATAQGGYGAPYSYRWTFLAPQGSVPEGYGTTVDRTFDKGGVFAATVNVTDRAGVTVERTWLVTVHAGLLTASDVLEIAGAAGVGVGLLTYFVALWRSEPDPGALSP